DHAIPNRTRVIITIVSRTQQVAVKSPTKRRVNAFAGFDHFVFVPHSSKPLTTKGTKVHKGNLNPSWSFVSLVVQAFSLRKLRRPRRYKTEINPKKTENAGTDHCNPSTKNVVTAIASNKTIPMIVNTGCARNRIGKL